MGFGHEKLDCIGNCIFIIFVIVVAIAISGAVIDKFVTPITIAITTTIASLGTSRRSRLNLRIPCGN